jgi:hypothetical protein
MPDLMAYLPLGVAVAASDLFSVVEAVSDVLLLQEKSSTTDAIMANVISLFVFILEIVKFSLRLQKI